MKYEKVFEEVKKTVRMLFGEKFLMIKEECGVLYSVWMIP